MNENVDGVGAGVTGSSDREFKGVGRGVERGVKRRAKRGVGDNGQNGSRPRPSFVTAVSLETGVLKGAQSDAV